MSNDVRGLTRHSFEYFHRLFAQVIASGVHHDFHCIVFELCHSTLYDIVQGYCGLTPLPAMHVMEISYQLVQAIQCELFMHTTLYWVPSYLPKICTDLHSVGIVHADIKLNNVALKCSNTVNIQWLDPSTGFHEKV